jgi:uncharacterized protein YpuA (DUF1002 family)
MPTFTGLRASSKRPPLVLQFTSDNMELAKSQAQKKIRSVVARIVKAYSLDLPEKELRKVIDRLYEEKRALTALLNSYNK